MTPITLAHSPDSDDAFMFFGLAGGLVDTEGLVFSHELCDIESLNRRAMSGELDVTAVSFHAYAFLADRYLLLPHGASFGDGYGPVVVSRRKLSREDVTSGDVVVASPGRRTTAALALALWAPGARTVEAPFDQIQPGVASGHFDAGLLIHEGQLTFADDGLEEVEDLGRWWKSQTSLPLPLGGNVVRRDLGSEQIARISRALRRSIEYGLAHRDAALAHAIGYSRGLDRNRADRFVSMYVNEWTRGYGSEGRLAVQTLLDRGAAAGRIPATRAEYADE
ncbi:MAG TPA: MqnA/MqnD/SBP family protein [Thermoanaerobaculia bacterium]